MSNSDFAFEIRERVFSKRGLIYDSGYWTPNTMTNEGQAHILNVWAREQPNSDKYLMLLNMPGGAAPTKATTYATLTEAITPGTNGYARIQVLPADWGAPSIDSGDEEILTTQKSFGQFTGDVPASHVGLISTSNGSGTFFLYVSNAYHTANGTSRVFVSGETYLVTLRDKQI